MCSVPECLTDGTIKMLGEHGAVQIKVGYINNTPFSIIVTDTRSGEHLHFPYGDFILAAYRNPSTEGYGKCQ